MNQFLTKILNRKKLNLNTCSISNCCYIFTDKSRVTLEEIKAMDERGEIKRKLEGAVKKDTIGVPDGGYALLRIHATNPVLKFLFLNLIFL